MNARPGGTAPTLAIALAGAAALGALGVPAAALLGATVAVTLAALSGLDARVPGPLRDLGFTTIGVLLGVGITPDILDDLARFPASLAALVVTTLAILAAGPPLLRRGFGADRDTATLAMSPGALSYTLALATVEGVGRGDVQAITVVQSLRLLLITLLLPPVVAFGDGATAAGPVAAAPALGLPVSALLIALAWGLGLGCRAVRTPAPFLVAGVIASGLAHGLGWLEGPPAEPLTFVGFAVAGAVIGSRFASITGLTLRRHLVAGAAAAAMALSISAAASAAVAHHLDLPFGQVWIAFAPGGVEAMSAMALALDYDPVYVATHHVFRLVLLMGLLPWLLRRGA